MENDVRVPITDFVRELASSVGRESAQLVVEQHIASCPAIQKLNGMDKRVQKLELSWAKFVGALFGAGGLGGTAATLLSRLF